MVFTEVRLEKVTTNCGVPLSWWNPVRVRARLMLVGVVDSCSRTTVGEAVDVVGANGRGVRAPE
jgi:hypothetical protein